MKEVQESKFWPNNSQPDTDEDFEALNDKLAEEGFRGFLYEHADLRDLVEWFDEALREHKLELEYIEYEVGTNYSFRVVGRYGVDSRLSIVQGDITQQDTDAIVNAANPELRNGSGVCGAIFKAGGQVIHEECRYIRNRIGSIPTGQAVITFGGNLKARHVIHTVGPVWSDGCHDEPILLARAYRESLKLAVSDGLKTVSFPSISTGAYGYPIELAARIALQTVISFLKGDSTLEEVVFVLFDDDATSVYEAAFQELLEECG